MVRVDAAQVVDVQGHPGMVAQALEEFVDEVDIEDMPEFGHVIEELTGGFRTVPTIRIGDDYLVNPTAVEVLAFLGD